MEYTNKFNSLLMMKDTNPQEFETILAYGPNYNEKYPTITELAENIGALLVKIDCNVTGDGSREQNVQQFQIAYAQKSIIYFEQFDKCSELAKANAKLIFNQVDFHHENITVIIETNSLGK